MILDYLYFGTIVGFSTLEVSKRFVGPDANGDHWSTAEKYAKLDMDRILESCYTRDAEAGVLLH